MRIIRIENTFAQMMLRHAVPLFALCCLGFCLALPPLPALAENIVWDGAPPPALENIPVLGFSLAPSGSDIGGYKSNKLSGNSITVNGDVPGNVIGGINMRDSAVVAHNRITINSGMVTGDVVGGYSQHGNAIGNSVTINGGTVTGNFGGGSSQHGNAIGNNVFINSGTVIGDVPGGYSQHGNATGNNIFISGGKVTGDVAGGVSVNGNATGNIVTVSGTPIFDPANTTLYGGYDGPAGNAADLFTGNILNVWNYRGSQVWAVNNFQFFNFRIPSNQIGPVLEVNGTASLGEMGGAGRGSTVTAINTNGNGTPPMPLGSSVTLIRAGTLRADDFTQTHTQGQHGATIGYLWTLDTANNELTATVVNVGARPETKALSEAYLTGTILVNQGADLIAGKGMMDAMRSAGRKGLKGENSGNPTGYGFGSFSAISSGWSRYHTGSHADMSGLSLMTGLSFGADLPPGRLTVGAFFEYGTGSYDTYNSFATDYHGKGNLYHLGGGVLAHIDFVAIGPGNFYTEASFRAGGLHNDYSTSDLRDIDGHRASYDSYSPYYGIHAGLGYVWNFTEKASLDLYARYFWTRQQGDSLTLATGDPVKFKEVDSHRLRLGGRFAYAINDYIVPYIGAAYEHEFDGRAKATTYGYKMPTPDLTGGTGIGELGLSFKPSKGLPLSFDLGVQGYVGKREGVTGSLQVRYKF